MLKSSYPHLAALRYSRIFRSGEANILHTRGQPDANPALKGVVQEEDVKTFKERAVSNNRLEAAKMNFLQGKSSNSLSKHESNRKSLLGSSEELAQNIREFKSHENQKIISSLMATKSADVIQYRKHEHPWELLLKPRRHRVNDMIGILLDEHRIEMEQIIWKICDVCEVDFYFVLVPTVGYIKPRVFAESLFTQWEVGTPIESFVEETTSGAGKDKRKGISLKNVTSRSKQYSRSLARGGNGVLLLLTQQEAMIELVASYALGKYFSLTMIQLIVKEVFQPLIVSGKDPSYAALQMIYAMARHSDEFKDIWKPYLYPLITLQQKNDALFLQQTFLYGCYRKKGLFIFTFLSILFGLWAVKKLQDLRCDECGTFMKRMVLPQSFYDEINEVPEIDELSLREAKRLKHLKYLFSIYGDALSNGQRIEMENECAEYKVFLCPSCKATKTRLIHRQFHNYNNCIKCDKCDNHTVSEQKEILRLPTKTEDGVKQFLYQCKNCHWENKTYLPLFHPIELHPKNWYDVLIERSSSPDIKTEIKTF